MPADRPSLDRLCTTCGYRFGQHYGGGFGVAYDCPIMGQGGWTVRDPLRANVFSEAPARITSFVPPEIDWNVIAPTPPRVTTRRTATSIIAYDYAADHHCVRCTVDRFGVEAIEARFDGRPGYQQSDGFDTNGIPTDAVDSEGNDVHPIFSGDEWCAGYECEGENLECGDCGRWIAECGHEPPNCGECGCGCERMSEADGRGCDCDGGYCPSCGCGDDDDDDDGGPGCCDTCDACANHADERDAPEAPTALEWIAQVAEMGRAYRHSPVRA